MRVPRRSSVTTTPRRRSSAIPSGDGRRADPERRRRACVPRAGAVPDEPAGGEAGFASRRTNPAALAAEILYCIVSVTMICTITDFRKGVTSHGHESSAAPGPYRTGFGCGASASAAATSARRSTRSSTRPLSRTSGIVDDGQPFVIPTLHARVGDVVYFHGSVGQPHAARAGRRRAGVPDGVAARRPRARARRRCTTRPTTARSLLLGEARPVEDARRAARGVRGDRRAHRPRPLAATSARRARRAQGHRACSRSPIDEASAKVRTGPAGGRRGGLRAAGVGRRDPAVAAAPASREPDPRLRAGIAPRSTPAATGARRGVAAQVGGGVHRAPARRLHLEQLERARAAARAAAARRAALAAPALGARPASAPPRPSSSAAPSRPDAPSASAARAPMCGCSARTRARAPRPGARDRAGGPRRPIFSA